jgi:hypothetical protein
MGADPREQFIDIVEGALPSDLVAASKEHDDDGWCCHYCAVDIKSSDYRDSSEADNNFEQIVHFHPKSDI